MVLCPLGFVHYCHNREALAAIASDHQIKMLNLELQVRARGFSSFWFLQEQRRAASERPKAIRSIPRARSGHWRSGTGRRLTPAQPAGAPLANAIALTGPPRRTGSPSMLPPGGGGGPSYAARRALQRGCASQPTARFDLATSSRRRSRVGGWDFLFLAAAISSLEGPACAMPCPPRVTPAPVRGPSEDIYP